MPAPKSDIKTLNAGLPYLRSILAFILYLRYAPAWSSPEGDPEGRSYTVADRFIANLKSDLEK